MDGGRVLRLLKFQDLQEQHFLRFITGTWESGGGMSNSLLKMNSFSEDKLSVVRYRLETSEISRFKSCNIFWATAFAF